MLASSLRLLGWILCTATFFNKSHAYIQEATFDKIKELAMDSKASNETLWLPVEPEEMNGLKQSPALLVVAIFTPEVFVVVSYLALCWLYFASFIDSHDSVQQKADSSDVTGVVRFRCLVVILILL